MKLYTPLLAGLIAVSGSVFAAEDNQTTAEAMAPAAEASTTEAANAGTVARATFASSIQDHEPTDKLSELGNNNEKVFYFTELKDMAGQTVTHRWEHNGQVMAEIPFEVGGNRWRVYSSKNLDPSWTGEWKASVVTNSGETLSVSTFSYTAAATDAGIANQTAPAAEGTTTNSQ